MILHLFLLIVPISLLNSYTNGGTNIQTSDSDTIVSNDIGSCNPPCQNGGNCLSFNTCTCPQAFKGPQCQYAASACSARKLAFNGLRKCIEKDEALLCDLTCPEGMEFQFPPEYVYTCNYATGMFMPTRIPQCLYAANDPLEQGPLYSNYDDLEVQFQNTTDIGLLRENFLNMKESRILENKPQPGSCFTWGGSHFKTFDGQVFSFTSTCEHTLVQDEVDHTFSIIVQNSKGCLKDTGDCYTIIKIYLQDKQYVLKHTDDGVAVFASGNRILPIPGRVPGIRTEISAHYIIVLLDGIGAKIKWNGQQLVQVEVQQSLWNKTSGLCGKIDGDPINDMLTKDNILPRNTATLARSWQVKELIGEICQENLLETYVCPAPKEFKAAEFCEKIFSDKRFASCQEVMDLRILMNACIWDYCSCKYLDSKQCACETLNVYVRECAHKGVTSLASWRDKQTCPMLCNGGRVYMHCAPPGGQALCGGASEKLNEDAECEEGCYCPEGTFLYNSKCIAKENCPCIHNGKEYTPGSSIPKECNTCSCSDGKWICTQLKCSARCSVFGDPHYSTFDGKHYDFMGQCTYTLVEHNNFTIEAENVACGGAITQAINVQDNLASCPKTVLIKIAGQTIKIKQGREVTVNGQEVSKLPFQVSGATIRIASSMFLVAELPNGAEVWWDGVTRVHVDVPPSFIGQTKGLCGTFNENQKDDFLTPEGDVEESAIPFANKWKSTETCDDIVEKIYSHPCYVNVQNKAAAQEHCSIIRSKLFADCNVDPETFYQDCLYDLCSCDTELPKCLCPVVAAYAEECARKGNNIDWRSEVRECGVQCPGEQVYQICGNPCIRSCSDMTLIPYCKQKCVEGCNCPEGKTLNENLECIPIGQCGCVYESLEYPSDYKEIRNIDEMSVLCTCLNALWSCRPATQTEIATYPKTNDTKAMCKIYANMEFTPCEPAEPITCKNMHSPELVSTAFCRAGCQCKKGYVLDGFSKTCVKPTECPCHHGGRSYSENSALQSDCNTCTCKQGKWQCTQNLCPGECSAWGDSHYKTFDGKLYDYQGQCDYMLVKGTSGGGNVFDISVQNVPCGSLGVSCSKSVSIRVGNPPNQEIITLTRDKEIPEHATLKQLTIRQISHFVIVEAPELKFLVRWDKGTRVYVKLDTLWKNKVKGLCGNYNDNQLDDFQTPYGGIAEVSSQLFGDSWRLQPYCPKALEITNTCEEKPDRKVWAFKRCGILKSSVFDSCHSEVPIESYFERCIFDTCACDQGGDCECLCTALAAYAQECNNKGIPIKWRTPELCPMQCDERCTNYSPCISTCPIETCDNTLVHKQLKKMCEQDTCIEGCQPKPCPLNFIYLNSSMLDCVPRNVCNPICLVIDGVEYYEGDILEEDPCYICHCSRGRKHCQGEPCVVIPPREPEVKCHSGWTKWINQDKTSINKAATDKVNDIEPLPGPLIMNHLNGDSRCEIQNIVDIECRTVRTHLPHKETGLDVECSLERGLVCRSKEAEKSCVDFEIRVKCECPQPESLVLCDISKPNEEHYFSCKLYYKCEIGENGPEMVEKICSDDMMFNPRTLQCDSQDAVIKLKPECSEKPRLSTFPPPTSCRAGQELLDCAIQCRHLCMHYAYQMQQRGHCLHGRNCEKGCVSTKKKQHSCPPGMYWTNSRTCIAKKDCMCISHKGVLVKPGETISESDCEICQCVDNYYTCDKSRCPLVTEIAEVVTTVSVTPATILPAGPCDVSQPSQEHPTNCYLYYECEIRKDGPKLKEKTCHDDMMYNPSTFKCDIPERVIALKPQCSKEPVCPAGEEFQDCSIQCRRLCMHYSYRVKQKGHCMEGTSCEKGCVANNRKHRTCPPGMYWANSHACIPKKDCMCVSHDGKPVKPGDVVQESNCEFCQCIDNDYKCNTSSCPITPAVQVSTTQLPPSEFCDVSQPSEEHYFNCRFYYKCEFGEGGPEMAEKTCGNDKLFNPRILECDFPEAVIKIKPQCSTERKVEEQPPPPPSECPAGEKLRDCSIQCRRMCMHYSHKMKESGHCLWGNKCETGCVSSETKYHSCPPGMYWTDTRRCVPKKDCECVSHNGTAVKPGRSFRESDCEICHCIDNYYSCDKSACPTLPPVGIFTTAFPPPEFCDVSQPNKEHYFNCHLYYKCEVGENGPKLVPKACQSKLMFNPTTLECDYPETVIAIKPQCSGKPGCPAGEEFQECSIQCRRLCMHYSYHVQKNGHCVEGTSCEKGCVANNRKQHSCPPGMYWANSRVCIPKKDCMCVSHDGTSVEPGDVVQESNCEFCQCIDNDYKCNTSACPITPAVQVSTTPRPLSEFCDVSQPSEEHYFNCRFYYKCEFGEGGAEMAEKTCGNDKLFNPRTLECDFLDAVIKIKPQCSTERIIEEKPPPPPSECPPGEELRDCSIQCRRMCMHYSHKVKASGHCLWGNKCEKGCASTKTKHHSCPPGMYWADTRRCVPKKECECVSHDGIAVKPGGSFKESDCEICHCIDNYYSCDKSACPTSPPVGIATTAPPPSEICEVSQPNKEHYFNCHLYYKCEFRENGPKLVEKVCHANLMFNPTTLECDNHETVIAIKPQCAAKPVCPAGEEFQDCSIQCRRLCMHYSYRVKQKGHCMEGTSCEKGCVANNRKHRTCPPGMYWANSHACIPKKDCMCVSHDGKPVKPGDVVQESNCEFCQCIDNDYKCNTSSCPITPAVQVSTTQLPPSEFCDVSQPSEEHYFNCRFYYKCEFGEGGPEMAEKTCGNDKLFNPRTLECDFPEAVIKIKPQCSTERKVEEQPPPPSECPAGEKLRDCSIQCRRMCMHYSHKMKESGHCLWGNKCETGCVSSETKHHSCPPGMYWTDTRRCVPKKDCECVSHNGTAVKPGRSFRESDCEICHCIDNYYSCDKSACPTLPPVGIFTTAFPPPEFCDVSQPNKEHYFNCHLYYKCEVGENGPKLVPKACQSKLMFNPTTLECDYPETVIAIKPQCSGKPGCPAGEEFQECSIQCRRLCMHYSYRVQKNGHCVEGTSCEKGCVPNTRKQHSCPPGMYWANSRACIPKNDCMCVSHDGTSVEPGDVVQESNCEFCQCIDNDYKCNTSSCLITPAVQVSTTPLPPSEFCDVSQPSEEHYFNCRLYYKCEFGEGGAEMAEKTCGNDKLFNPRTLECDFPDAVIKIKPQCSTERIIEEKPPPPPSECPPGEELRDCSIQCRRMCMHYSHKVKESGHCLWGNKCEKGCVSTKTKHHSCPPGMYWADTRRCVPKKECECVSHDGIAVKPGGSFKESDCEICHCIDNYYSCDKSACPTSPPVGIATTAPPPSEICEVSQPNKEHYFNCHLYYKCEFRENGPKLVEKVCHANLMFNPTTLECDNHETVIAIKPQCAAKPVCPAGEEFQDCSIQCRRLCMHYSYRVKQKGHCMEGTSCEKGCVANNRKHRTCPPGMYWANSHACIPKKDCMCVSHDGKPVKPGDVVQESNCEFCQCIDNDYKCNTSSCPITPAVQVSTTPLPPSEFCDVSQPSEEHYFNCRFYYKCEFGEGGPEMAEKTCDIDMLFNPRTLECDFPEAVIKIKPQCSTERKVEEQPPPPPYILTAECPAGEKLQDCSIQCRRMCMHYSHKMKESGHCLWGNKCETGCVSSETKHHSCPPGMYWTDTRRCVPKKDCECVSHNGTAVKPGRSFRESDCEICHCIDNYYSCDKSACPTLPPVGIFTTAFPPPEFCDVSQPNKEHYFNCHLYYKCEVRENGPKLVKKACQSNLMFNPTTLECDYPETVLEIKPQCFGKPGCPAGEEFQECSIQCRRLCMHYSYHVRKNGHCVEGTSCEKGCVPNNTKQHSCPPGMYWANSRTCMAKKDCMCVSHDGTPVEPGDVVQESHCEFCQCIDNYYKCNTSSCPITPAVQVSTTPLPTSEFCDVSHPSEEHYFNCRFYYKCEFGEDGPEMVEKTCGNDMLFNPRTLECDFPDAVIKIKPQCLTERKIEQPPPPPSECPPGEELRDCSIQCRRMCMHYSHKVKGSGHCLWGNKCEKGCVSTKTKHHSCPPGMYWADTRRCVPKKDCECVSHDGIAVKPGESFKESDCETCHCIDNYYTCDTSACPAPTVPTVTTHSTIQTAIVSVSEPILIIPTTSTPPGKCAKENYIKLIDGDTPLGDEAFTASSTLSSEFAPKYAHLSSNIAKESGGSWVPQISNKDQYLQVDLGRQEPIYGIITEGSPLNDEYVTTYTVLYSPDGHTYDYITDRQKETKVFRGSSAPITHILDIPIEAQILRIQPQTWHNAIALRVELIGCRQLLYATQPTITTTPAVSCTDYMGVDNSMMADQQISVSTELKPYHTKDELKLSSKNAWQPSTDSPSEWIQFDFLEPRNITGFVTRGGAEGWVTIFNVKYSHNGKDWNPILDDEGNEQIFLGNVDEHTAHVVNFDVPIQTTFLKITPTEWHKNIQLRIEPRGCFIPYPTERLTTTKAPPSKCNNCLGVFTSDECICKEDLWWDGNSCVPHARCPCMVGHIPYAVGVGFENEDCSQCMCKLGGIAHCKPKVCEECDQGLQRVVTSTCKCTCRPCANGTTLCPTSNICINVMDWCNGVKDCPDDETGCFVTSATSPTISEETEAPPKCVEPVCPPGYVVVLKKTSELEQQESGLKTMFTSDTKTAATKTGYKKTGDTKRGYEKAKEGHRIGGTNQRENTPPQIAANEKCILFDCVAVRIPSFPGVTKEPCPEIVCPPGYTLELYYEDLYEEIDGCPSYECKPTPTPDVVCNITGRTFNTFDLTDYKYDICNHILARDLENKQWKISIKKNCSVVCSRSLIINHDEHTFVLHPDLSIEYDGFKYTVEQMEKISSSSDFFEVNQLGDTLVFVTKAYGFWVNWDKQTNAKIGITRDLLEKVDGLCGYFNDNSEDDKRMPNGTVAKITAEFGNSWAEPGESVICETRICPADIRSKASEICNLVKQKIFEPCVRTINTDAFVSRCIEMTCRCLEAAKNDKNTEDRCRCSTLQTFVVDCLTANSGINVVDWRLKFDCPVPCESPLVHHDCYRRRCEPSCGTLSDNACPQLTQVCFPGCYCPSGYVRKGEECIPPANCRDCECNVLPHLQYVTYDERNFTINGKCVYIMSRDILDSKNLEHQFQVLITNSPCEHKHEQTCIGEVTILYKGHKIHVARDIHHRTLQLLADSKNIFRFEEISDWAQVTQDPVKHLRILLSEIQVLVSVYYPSLGVSVKASSFKFGGKLEGLCGNCDRNKDNDFQTLKGTAASNTNELALSWLYDGIPGGQNTELCGNQTEEQCEEILPQSDPCIQLVNSKTFGQCHPVLSPNLFIEWCRKDICNGHLKHACRATEAYAYECGHHGFCIDWRTQLCPAKECPAGQEYQPCAPMCSQTCEALNAKDTKCKNAPIEGCFCPEGKVSLNDTCVVKERCEPCDDKGHYSGDSWQKDRCTKCKCEGTNIQCETETCSTINTICEDGYTKKNISKKDECCEKYTCVQTPPTEICKPEQVIQCGPGQIMNIIKKADGRCKEYVCECVPKKDCESVNRTSTILKPGFVENIDESGCCPIIKQECIVKFCPKAPSCPKFHFINELPADVGECCPEYRCVPPKNKCIVDLSYTEDEKGGERPRHKLEKQQVLKEAEEKWHDGPCRECQCIASLSGDYHDVCTVTECPILTESIDNQDYVLEPQYVVGQCCATIKKVACKYDGQTHEVGEKWFVDPCTSYKCTENAFGIQKVMQIKSCNTKCDLGWEYQPATQYSKECCGLCKPVACVANGITYNIGKEWTSPDHCITYYCSSINGSVQITSVVENCTGLSDELLKDYDVEIITPENECCKSQKIVACKDGNKTYQKGETWRSSDGDKCKNISCTENKLGQIIKQESVETCNTNCLKGWEYKESDTQCCGECVQMACVVDNQRKHQGDNWTSSDGCTTYFCDSLGDQLTVRSEQEFCPNVDDCPLENIYSKGCCKHCNLTTGAQVTCNIEIVDPSKTVGLILFKHEDYGECINTDPLEEFTECIGNCKSFTSFNSATGQHESVCSCCQATAYKSLKVYLQCPHGKGYEHRISMPSNCGCEDCIANKSTDLLSKTGGKVAKRQIRYG